MNKSEITLGKIIEGDANRDAIHIAVAPVVAISRLAPGQDIGFMESDNQVLVGICDKPIGIVDPFLYRMVFKDQKFWMFLYPNTITSLRHDWTHPAFESVQSADKGTSLESSMKWMENFAAEHHYFPNYYTDGETSVPYTAEEIINHVTDFLKTGDRYVQQGSESLRDCTNSAEFWRHYERITGNDPGDDARKEVPFCCTC